MPEHVWSVACYRGCLDSYTNLVSIHDVTEAVTLTLPGEPPAPPQDLSVAVVLPLNTALHVVSLWLRSDPAISESFKIRTVVITPDGAEFPSSVYGEGDLREHARLRTFLQLPAIPIRGPGLYRIAVEHRSEETEPWVRAAKIPVDVQFQVVQPQLQFLGPKATKARKFRQKTAAP